MTPDEENCMILRFSKIGLLFLGIILALSLARNTAAEEEDSISIANAEWIAAGTLGVAEDQTPTFGLPGAHVRPGESTPTDSEGPMPIFHKCFILDRAAVSCMRVAICGLIQAGDGSRFCASR